MPAEPSRQAIEAIRSIATTPDDQNQPTLLAVLEEHAHDHLFNDALLGPARALGQSAARVLGSTRNVPELSDAAVYQLWLELIDGALGQWLADGNSLEPEHEAADFIRRCALVFGIEEDRVQTLLKAHVDLSEGERFAVLRAISASPSFGYLAHRLSVFHRDIVVESPTGTLRKLIRLTL